MAKILTDTKIKNLKPQDKAYIESVDGFMEFGRTQILDFSDKLSTPSFADEDSQKLLEELLKGENE